MTTYFDQDLVQHLYSSLSKYLQPTVAAMDSVTFFVDGVDLETKAAFETDSAVLKINGPWFEPYQGKNYHRVEVMVMMTALSGINTNRYKLFTDTGVIANELSKPIAINRHSGDGSLIGCLDVDRRSRDFVRVVNFGQIDKDSSFRQMAVVARYELSI